MLVLHILLLISIRIIEMKWAVWCSTTSCLMHGSHSVAPVLQQGHAEWCKPRNNTPVHVYCVQVKCSCMVHLLREALTLSLYRGWPIWLVIMWSSGVLGFFFIHWRQVYRSSATASWSESTGIDAGYLLSDGFAIVFVQINVPMPDSWTLETYELWYS